MEDIVIQRSCSLTTYHLKVHIQTLTKQAINQFLKFWGMMHHEILVLHCKNFRLDVSSKCEALLQPSKLSITVAGKNKTESQNLQHSLNSVVSSYLSHPNCIAAFLICSFTSLKTWSQRKILKYVHDWSS